MVNNYLASRAGALSSKVQVNGLPQNILVFASCPVSDLERERADDLCGD